MHRCNGGWTRQTEESVSVIVPKLIHGQQMQLSTQDQQALAFWSVATVLLLQHTQPGSQARHTGQRLRQGLGNQLTRGRPRPHLSVMTKY